MDIVTAWWQPASVTASSELPGHPASRAVDLDRAAGWYAQGQSGASITLDLGTQRPVAGVMLQRINALSAIVGFSNDNASYTESTYAITRDTRSRLYALWAAYAVTARYWRVRWNSGDPEGRGVFGVGSIGIARTVATYAYSGAEMRYRRDAERLDALRRRRVSEVYGTYEIGRGVMPAADARQYLDLAAIDAPIAVILGASPTSQVYCGRVVRPAEVVEANSTVASVTPMLLEEAR